MLSVLIPYPFAVHLKIWNNFSVPDVWLILCFGGLLSARRGRMAVTALFNTGYGIITLVFLLGIATTSFINGDAEMDFAPQMLFVYLFLIPYVASTVAVLRVPTRWILFTCEVFTMLYILGVLLRLLGGNETFVYRTGNNRYFAVWSTVFVFTVCHSATMFGLYSAGRFGLKRVVPWAIAILAVIMFTSSRSTLVGCVISSILAITWKAKQGEIGTSLVALVVVGLLGSSIIFGSSLRTSVTQYGRLNSRFVTKGGMYDSGRIKLVRNGIQALSNTEVFIAGTGHSNFHDAVAGQSIHNAFLQYLVESGVPVGSLYFLLYLFPLYASRRLNGINVAVGRIIYISASVFLLLAPISTLREQYIPFAFAIGLMLGPIIRPGAKTS